MYDKITSLYKKDNTFLTQKLKTETEILSDDLLNETSRPFGKYGEVTLNQIGVNLKENMQNLKEVNWEYVYDQTRLTIHGLPAAVNAVSYGLVLKTYMKYVHNRPLPTGISLVEMEWLSVMRNRQLALFCILGAPLTMGLLKASSVPLKDMFTVTVGGSQEANSNSNLINSTLFLSNLITKIPRWIRILFRILFVTILILKFRGFSVMSFFFINTFNWKLISYTVFSIIIIYHLLNLYLLHQISNKKIKVLDIWPEFIIQWLKELEDWGSSKAGKKAYKTECYVQITLYLILY